MNWHNIKMMIKGYNKIQNLKSSLDIIAKRNYNNTTANE